MADITLEDILTASRLLADPLRCSVYSAVAAALPEDISLLNALHVAVSTNTIRDFDIPAQFYTDIGAVLVNCLTRPSVVFAEGVLLPVPIRKLYEIVLGVTHTPEFLSRNVEYWPPDFAVSLISRLFNRLFTASSDALKFQERVVDRMGGVTAATAKPDVSQPVSGSLKSLKAETEMTKESDGSDPLGRNTAAKTAPTRKEMLLEEMTLARSILWYLYMYYADVRPSMQRQLQQSLREFITTSNRFHCGAIKHCIMLVEALLRSCAAAEWPVQPSKAVGYSAWFEVLLDLHHTNGQLAESLPIIALFHEHLVLGVLHLLKCPEVEDGIARTIQAIVSCWEETKLGNSAKALLLLQEIVQLLQVQQRNKPTDDEVAKCLRIAFPIVLDALSSDNSRVAQLALGMFKNEFLVNALLLDSEKLRLTDLMRVLWRGGNLHWNATVNKLTHTVITSFVAASKEKSLAAFKRVWIGDRTEGVKPPAKIPRLEQTASAPVPTAVRGLRLPPSGAAGGQPPVTITGVAPWAMAPGKPVHPSQSAGRRSAAPESDGVELTADLEARVNEFLLSLLPPPVSSVGLYGSEAPAPEVNDNLAAVPMLKPSLVFHDLVFGQELGSGSFSVVKYAKQIRRGSSASTWPEYAVKIISTKTMSDLGYEPSVRREITVLSMMTHPNIARLVSAFRWKDGAYLVTEYAPRGDLHTTLTQLGSLEVDAARFLVAEVMAAAHHIHSKGFVFGDIKPENILLVEAADGGCHAKLTDFGACRSHRSDAKELLAVCKDILKNLRDGGWRAHAGIETAAEPSAPSAADAGTELSNEEDERIEGTEEYLPPEVVNNSSLPTVAADAYALGVTLYQLLKGELIGSSDVWPDLTEKRGSLRFKAVADVFAGVDDSAKDVISRLLHPQPEKRLGGGSEGLQEVMAHPFFAALGSPDTIMQLYSKPAPKIRQGVAAPQADPAWSRRHNSTIWAPMPRSYNPVSGETAASSQTSRTASIRDLLQLPALPSAAL